MKTYLEHNIAFLKKAYPSIYEFANGQSYDKEKYVLCGSKNQEVNICIKTEEIPVYLHSKYNPTKEAESWVNSISDRAKNAKNILVIGLACGYHIQALITRFPNKKFYLYEPEHQLFLAAIKARNMNVVLDHPNIVTLAIGQDQSIRHSLLRVISENVSDSFECLILPVYNKINGKLVEEFGKDAETVLSGYRTNLATVTSFQLNWPENILYNVSKNLVSPSIQSLKSTCDGMTAIIVGSGPSLEKDIEYLRKLDNHCLIIAAGSSIQALLYHKIKPHLIVSIDGGEPNLQVFRDLDLSEIPFLYAPQIKFEILEGYEDNLIHVMLSNDLISRYLFDAVPQMAQFSSTTTVTGTAIQAAVFMGCKRIVFMGQDLSYPDDKYYSSGVDHISENIMSETLANASEWVENVDGGKNRTTDKMIVTLNNVEQLLSHFPDIQFINASKKGAKIKNTIYQPIEEIFDDLTTNHFETNWFKEIISQHMSRYDDNTISKVIQKVRKTKSELQLIEKRLNNLHKQIKDLDRYVQSGIGNVQKRLLGINKSWKSITNKGAFDNIYYFSMEHYMSVYMRYVPDIVKEQDPRKKSELIVRHLGTLVSRMIQYTPIYLSYFDEAIRRIEEKFPQIALGDQQ